MIFSEDPPLFMLKELTVRALHNFLTQIDVALFADCLNRWLSSHMGTLPRALAVDGKWVCDHVLILCLCEHETGAAVAIGFAE